MTIRRLLWTLLLLPLTLLTGCQLAANPIYAPPKFGPGIRPTRVLFIGNSLTYYNDLAGLVQQLSAREERPLEVDTVTVANASLKLHYTMSAARKHLARGGWDYVVLQEYSSRPADDPQATMQDYRMWSPEVAKVGARPIIFENWTHEGRNEDAAKMRATYNQVQAAIGGEISPIGQAWQLCRQKHPEIDMFSDHKHPSTAGTYLTACVLYKTIYHKPATGLPTQITGLKLMPETARKLQAIADEVR